MKIIGFCGSPRKNSNSTRMVEEVLRGAQVRGARVEVIKIGDLKIELCDGCLVCDETAKCHFCDDMDQLGGKMAKADGFVFGTPDRFDNISPHLKNFMDRTNPLAAGKILKGKKAALVTAGYWREDISRKKVIRALTYFCDAHEIEVVGNVMAYEKSGKPGMVRRNKKVMRKCFKLGQKLVEVLV